MADKLDFSNLKLKEIELVTEKPKVLILDNNNICKIDKLLFQPQLLQLSIAHNDLIQINGLNTLINLTVLNLSNNKIISIDGLKSLKNLTWLNLSNNRIKKVENLDHNLSLKHLDLSDNLISKLSNINHLIKLKTLLLHGNEILTLENFSKYLPSTLEILSLAENCLSDLTEIQYLKSLVNLKQLSLKENPCVNQKILCDYRPYMLLWCPELSIIDGSEVTEKEGLITEWLLAQGEIRHFKVGQHADLIYYLTQKCYFTNSKNKSKLQIELDNILEQRKKLSSRGSSIHEGFYKKTSSSILASDTFNAISHPSEHLSILSTDIQSDDGDNDKNDDKDEILSVSNSSMLLSESSFLPVVASPQKPQEKPQSSNNHHDLGNGDGSSTIANKHPDISNQPSSPNSIQQFITLGATGSIPFIPQVSSAPTVNNKDNNVPLLKYSNEDPKLYHKQDLKRQNILNASINESTNSSRRSSQNFCLESLAGQKFLKTSEAPILSQINKLKQQKLSLINQKNNNATPQQTIINRIPVDKIIRIQAWWRGVRVRLYNPTVSNFLKHRENQRTRSHIYFLHQQMKLYYESYTQQRKVNSSQTEAISFLIDQVKSLCKWQEDFKFREAQYQETLDLLTSHQEEQNQQQIQSTSQFQLSAVYCSRLEKENQEMSLKITQMQREIQMLRDNIGKIEGTITEQKLKFDETINKKFPLEFYPDHNKDLYNKQNPHDVSGYDDASYSDPSDLRRVMLEAQKYVNGDYQLSESEAANSELPTGQQSTNISCNDEPIDDAHRTKVNIDQTKGISSESNINNENVNYSTLTDHQNNLSDEESNKASNDSNNHHQSQLNSEHDATSKQIDDITEDQLGDTIVELEDIREDPPPFRGYESS